MCSRKALFMQMQSNFVTHMKLMRHLMLIVSLLVLGIGFIQDVMNLLVNLLDALYKPSCFINLRLYMCGLCLCSHKRHDNINQTQWLRYHTHLEGASAHPSMERFVIVMLHIGKALISCLWMLGVLHA